MEYQRASDAAAFSKKLNNGRSFNGKSMYDGVFGGQSRGGTRVEDYAEIFGGASGSSIPVLDVPELNQRKFSVDVSSSKLDYSNIFGGFRDFDFAVSHDELIAKPTRDKKRQAKTRSHSEGSFSNPPSIPLGNQVLLNDQSSNESGNGVKQFKMSFNKSIPGSKHGRNGTTHVAELHAVPGYTRLIDDRITPSRDKSVPSVVNEPYGTNNFDQGKMEGMQCKKPVSNVPSTDFSKQASEGVDEWHGESRSNGSDPNDVLFGFYDVGRRTPPSKVRRASSMSYNMDGNKRDSLKFGVSRSHSFDGDAGVSSPPYFDDEVDANSVAATSAAAVKKAIEEAQARLKVAKEMMERRKEGHIGRFKPSSNGSLKAKESKKSKDTIKQNNSGQDIAQERCENMDAGLRKQSVMKAGKVAAESEDREKSFIAEEAAGGTCAKNFISSQADCRQEEEKKSEAAKEGEREKDGKQALCEYEQEKKITENPEKYGEKLELLEGKVDASQELCDREECLHKLKPDLEFHDEKEDETKLKFSERREETEEKVCIELEAFERKLEDQENPTEDERKVEMQDLKDIDNLERRTADQESVDKGEKHEHMLKQEENGYALGDVFEKEENEMLQQDVSIQNEEEKICEEAFEISELKEGHQGACGPEENNEDNEQILDKMEKPEIFGLRYNGFDYEEERERRLEENGDSMGNEEFMEAEENGDLFKDAYQMEAVEKGEEEAPEKVGTEEMQKHTEQKVDETTEGNEDLFKDAYQTEMVEEGQKEIPERVEIEEMQNQIDQNVNETTEENGDLFKDAYQVEAMEEGEEEAPKRVGTEEMQKQTDQKADETAEGNEDLFKDAYQMEMVEEGQKEIPERVEIEEMQNQIDQNVNETTEENGDLFKDAYQVEAMEEGEEEAPKRVGTEEMQKQTDQKADETAEGNEDLFKDAYQMEMVEEGQKEIPERVEIEEMQNQIDQNVNETTEENGDLFKDAYQVEAMEEGQEEAPKRVGTEEMQKQTDQKADETAEGNEDLFKDAYQMEMVEEGQKEIPERVGIEEMQNQTDQKADETTEENGDLFKDAYRMEAVEGGGKEVPERVGAEEMQKQIDKNVDETTEAGEDALGCCRDDLEAANDAYDDNGIIDLDETLEPAGNEDSCEMTPELLVNKENGEIAEGSKAYTECKETRRDSEAVEVANYLEENLAFKKADLAGSNFNLSEIEQQKVNRKQEFDFYRVRIDNHTGDTTFEQNQYEQHSEESEIICTREKHVEELASESEENSRQAEFGLKQEYNKCNFEISDDGRSVDSQLHCKFGEKHETMQIADEIEASQSTGYNEESHHGTLTKEEGDTKNSSHEEVKLVKEQQRRIDEAKEKERERERERLAVERAIREARGRAFAEARERAAAGRTNVEARRKVKGEAQGESAKPSADANDKTFMEAKIKAERAAVERANAEARQRALEKALSEKASFGARKQAEKLSDANQSFQSYDSPYKGTYPPATSRYPNSTNQSASNSSEGLDGASGESTQRCKARLERHRRTAERAAKALAEKNKRDLLAQKEQDERNRLAETVDAEVKRWSSGKRGNLRALLSTLQYILGPDSGWQPIPLTDIIATAAVKKAYRKATLCVHPDKLQQRGASIQQKYTCEKVFDLLKEAWNKFSAEER
ncbi:hypothetical protein PTKIN_Ptkin09bG0117500 [Pterospermum kingtungense]